MKLKKILIAFVFFFIIINIAAYITIFYFLKINIYNQHYLEYKDKFSYSQWEVIPHPFFGSFKYNTSSEHKNPKKNSENFLFENISLIKNNNAEKKIKILFLGGDVVNSFFSYFDNKNIKYSKEKKTGYSAMNEKKIIENQKKINLVNKIFSESFKNIDLEIYNATVPGFKQPQQLFKLYYLYFHGYRFDYIINMSGHHELVHPITKNANQFLPLDWPAGYINAAQHLVINYNCLNKNNFLKKIYTGIPVVELVILNSIRICNKEISSKTDNKYYKMFYADSFTDKQIIKSSIDIWKMSEEEMNNFALNKNSKFISVIMPNQYLKDSKIFSNYEKEQLMNYKVYGNIIERHYGKLNHYENSKINNKLDLRYIFTSEKKTMYLDSCCRYNEKGIEKILNEIIKEIKSDLKIY